MTKYEMLYILSNRMEDEAKDAVVAKFENIVTSAGGSVEKVDRWGTKKLAYPINYQSEGFYVLMTFECATSVIAEITRVAGITEGMLRHIVIKRA